MATPLTDAIKITNLMKRYEKSLAVEDLSLDVPRGSMFGFLGPNGSGKSTTIGCLTGMLSPTSGTVDILGSQFTSENADLKRRMGVMPETLGLFDQLYAHEFLSFVGRMYGLHEGEVQQRVRELLAALDLTDSAKTLAEYSTGMRKRVSFAAAVIHSPDILFLDEPFESIDPAGVALMKQWLRRFTEQGRTVFITSHVLETVERLCDHVAVIKKPGKLMWRGNIEALGKDGTLRFNECEFHSLEELFLHLTGQQYKDLKWL